MANNHRHILPCEIPTDDPRWLHFISRSDSQSCIFHHPAWIAAVAGTYGLRSTVLATLDSSDQIIAGLPLMRVPSPFRSPRLCALPFTDFCPPLCLSPEFLPHFLDGLRGWRETRSGRPELEIRSELPVQNGLYRTRTCYSHQTMLPPDSRALFLRLDKSRVRSAITGGRGSRIEIRRSNEWEDLRKFYELHLYTRRRLGVPVQPLRFFRRLFRRVISAGMGFTAIAFDGTRPVAGAVFFHWNGVLTYKFAASGPPHPSHPNHKIIWDAMQWGCAGGMRLFDWGRTDPENSGLRGFKSGWGGLERMVSYSVLADTPPAGHTGRDNGLLRRMASAGIRHAPLWVCRAAGELFYRFAA